MDVIGMTNLQEAKLAREAEICYATLALVTDYDCWHPDHDSVTVDLIVANLTQNAKTAQAGIAHAVERLGASQDPVAVAGTLWQQEQSSPVAEHGPGADEERARPDHRKIHEIDNLSRERRAPCRAVP